MAGGGLLFQFFFAFFFCICSIAVDKVQDKIVLPNDVGNRHEINGEMALVSRFLNPGVATNQPLLPCHFI